MIGQRLYPTKTRVAHLAIAFAVALLLTMIVTTTPTYWTIAAYFLPYFPEGLFFLKKSPWWVVAVGWAVYLALSTWLLRTGDGARYRVLLGLLCVLLMINVAGCHYTASHFGPSQVGVTRPAAPAGPVLPSGRSSTYSVEVL
jgi:hypothetical protein